MPLLDDPVAGGGDGGDAEPSGVVQAARAPGRPAVRGLGRTSSDDASDGPPCGYVAGPTRPIVRGGAATAPAVAFGGLDDDLDDEDESTDDEASGGYPSLDRVRVTSSSGAPGRRRRRSGAEPGGAAPPRSRVMLLAVSESLKRRYDFGDWDLPADPFVPRASLRESVGFGAVYRSVCVDDGHLGEVGFRATYGAALREFYDAGGLVVVLSSSAALTVPSQCISPLFDCDWAYAAGSPRDDYAPTAAGVAHLGDTGPLLRACTKATLLKVPDGEALLVPRRLTAAELDMTEAEYECYEPAMHTPVALRANPNGGRVAYVGFDGDDPAVASLVRCLACRDPPESPS